MQIRPAMLYSGFDVYSAASGTRNMPQIIAHGDTMAFHNTIGRERVEQRVRQLQAYLRQRMREILDVTPLVPDIPELSSGVTSYSFSFSLAKASDLYRELRQRGIDVKSQPRNSLRISTHISNSEAQIDRLVDELKGMLDVSTAMVGAVALLPKAATLQRNYPNPTATAS